MKKLTTFVFALLLAASLSYAQTGGDKARGKSNNPTQSDKKAHKGGKKGHKGGKKGKKGSTDTGSTTPK